MKKISPLRRWLRAKVSRQVATTAICIIISLVLALGLLSYFFTRHISIGNIQNQLSYETSLVAQRLELELNQIGLLAERLSAIPLIRNAIVDSTGRKAYLLPFINQYQISLLARCDIVLADFSGEVIASNSDRTQRITSDWYGGLMEGKQPRVAIEQDAEALHLSLAWPIIFPYTRESEGVLIVEVDLREMLVNLGLTQGEMLIQLRQGDKPALFGAIFAESSVLQKGLPLNLKSPLDRLALRLVVAKNKDQALAPLNALIAIHVGAAALAILVAVALLVVFTRRMVAPIVALSQVARDVHETGKLDVDIPVGRDDELGILAKAFSSMLAKLSVRQEELEDLILQRTQEISLSEARYRLIAENTSDVIWLMEVASGRITYASPTAARLTGLRTEELQGQTMAKVLTPESYRLTSQSLPERIARYQAGDESLRTYITEADVCRKDGSVVFTEAVATLITDDSGQVTMILGVSRDITERKRSEEEKALLEAQLRHAQKMQAVGTLAGGIAHEFNNLLAIVMGYAELARDLGKRKQDNTGELDQIIQASERASALVRQMLTFSRKTGADKKPLNINISVVHTARMLEQTLPRAISIATHLAPNLPLVEIDSSQLGQVLINLATNARDAMPEGGKLGISTELVSMPETVCSVCGGKFSGDHILLTVTDTGQGMDQHTLEQMFEPFFSTKGVGKGTGLGLSVVLGLVQDHGGHINCESNLGVGSIFKIYLPFHREGVVAGEEAQPSQGQMPGGTETILVVDDEEALRSLGKSYLGTVGYQVIQAQSGEEALEIYQARGGDIALVVLDLGMPGMGGQRCLKEILALNPQAKVVIASGYTADAQVSGSLESGAGAFVAKPYKRADLLATVREVLDR